MRVACSMWAIALGVAVAMLPGAPHAAVAQGTAMIRGTITDSTSRQPISGVQVQIVGTTRGTITGSDGAYVLRGVSSGNVTVRAQRIGYAPAERRLTVAASDTAVANFALQAVAATLGEVVVVGYGTSSRADVSSAVATVSGAEIANAPVAGVDAALQGKAPGVQVMQNAGNPGNGITIRVRGSSSISASNQPLWVIDGVPVLTEDFSQLGLGGQGVTGVTGINPDEIESITVLKDAASAAIYGSRASNGVVLVTTKRGAPGKARITFSAYQGYQNASKRVAMLNAQQYVEYMGEAAANDGYDPEEEGFLPGVDDKINTDWQSSIFRQAPIRDFNIGMSGGNERMQYFLSGSFFDQQGIVIGSGYKRAAGRLNMDFAASDKLGVKASLGVSRELNDRIFGDNTTNGQVTNALGNQPNVPIRNADGSFTSTDDGLEYPNSVALGVYNNSPLTTDRAVGNVEARYDLTSHFRITGRAGVDVLSLRERQWQSPEIIGTYAAGAKGVSKSGYTMGNRYVLESFLTYEHADNDDSRLTVTGGSSVEVNKSELNYVRGEGFAGNDFHYVGNAAKVTEYDGSATGHNLTSFFSRANYSLLNRYLFSASIRADGSSRFGANHRYGVFPAASLGWFVNREPFMGNLGRRMGDLKLRVSYGFTGNQGISDFASRGAFGSANYGGVPGFAPMRFANPDLQWESTREFDMGFDWDLFDGRIGIIADYYHKATSHLLVSRPITSTSGYSRYWDNVGSIENKGVEFGLTTVNVRPADRDGLEWRTEFNISANRNKVTALYNDEPFSSGYRSANRVQVGQPLGAWYMLKFKGVDPQTGDAIYEDLNDDGKINDDDRMIVGSPHPKYWGGITNSLSFKGFELRGFVQFSQGSKVFNAVRLFADDGGYYYDNKIASVMKRWQKPGDITDQPRASYDGDSGARLASSRFLEDGSYVRIQEITLSYRLPAALSRNMSLQNAQAFISGNNLHTFTKYSGYNPDVNSNGSSASISLGTDFYAYPLARTFMFGIRGEW